MVFILLFGSIARSHTNSVGFLVSGSGVSPCVAGAGANCYDVEVFFGSWHNSVGGAEGDLAIFLQNSNGTETQVIGQSAVGGSQVPFTLNHSLVASLPNFDGTNYWLNPELLKQYFSLGQNYFFHDDRTGTLSSETDGALYFERLMGHQSATAQGLGSGTYRIDYDLATKSGLSADWKAMSGIGNSRFRLLTDGRISVLIAPDQFTDFASASNFKSIGRMANALGSVRPSVRTSATDVGAMFEGLYDLDLESFYQSIIPLSGQIHAISLGDVVSFNFHSHETYLQQLAKTDEPDGYWTKTKLSRSVSRDNEETTGREVNLSEIHFGKNFSSENGAKIGWFFGAGNSNLNAKSSGNGQLESFLSGVSYRKDNVNWAQTVAISLGNHRVKTSRLVPLYQKLNIHEGSRSLSSLALTFDVTKKIQATKNLMTKLKLGATSQMISAEAINESGSNETALSSNKTSTYITHGIVGSTVSYSTKVGSYKGTNSINLNAKIPLGKQPHQRLELHEAHWNTFSAPNDLEMKFGFDSSFTLNSIINFELTAEKKLSGNRDFTFELQLKAGF